MADWRQIQARIRKAKAGADPPGQLAALYEKTRDAMVAFELAKLREKSGQTDEAVRWYRAAAERFRRAQWKTKAEEALTRLGAILPTPVALETPSLGSSSSSEAVEKTPEVVEAAVPLAGEAIGGAQGGADRPRRRRRGRRGGRGRRRSPQTAEPTPVQVSSGAQRPPAAPGGELPSPEPALWRGREEFVERERAPVSAAEPTAITQARGRAGDPGLASRLAHLESQLRRLIASPLYRLDEADQAPAGPGVFILSDADQTTYYYVENCQTLRIGVSNLLRAERDGRRRRGDDSLRSRLAEHLEINEARVTKYLKEQCVVRWLELDEGASHLAHFAIAVLRPVLND
ncbi:MAG TPA: hypothetical protein VKE24_16135 [Candidatus Acidoferrales bacterium]|nr:hypothetical protein [Candidatus Acidoferrales bacterium]